MIFSPPSLLGSEWKATKGHTVPIPQIRSLPGIKEYSSNNRQIKDFQYLSREYIQNEKKDLMLLKDGHDNIFLWNGEIFLLLVNSFLFIIIKITVKVWFKKRLILNIKLWIFNIFLKYSLILFKVYFE